MPTHRTTPIACVTTWETVMQAAGWRCQCTDACGSRHSRTGLRCDRDQDRARLVAAPLDLTLDPLAAARVPVAELRAWCPDCHRRAAARKRAHDRERRHRTADDALALFNL